MLNEPHYIICRGFYLYIDHRPFKILPAHYESLLVFCCSAFYDETANKIRQTHIFSSGSELSVAYADAMYIDINYGMENKFSSN